MYANLRGMKSKIPSINEVLTKKKPDIVVFLETHHVGKSFSRLPGYSKVAYNNRKKSKGGGMMIAIADNNQLNYVTTSINEENEMMWVIVKGNQWKFRIGIVYGKQETQEDEESLD